jgi:hypothetical protein
MNLKNTKANTLALIPDAMQTSVEFEARAGMKDPGVDE